MYPLAALPDGVRSELLAARREAALRRAQAQDADALSAAVSPAWQDWEHARPWRRQVAELRQRVLLELDQLKQDGMSASAARALVAERLQREKVRGSSVAAIKRWEQSVQGHARSDWLPLLMPSEERGRREAVAIHPVAWAIFKRDWLRPEKPTAAHSYRLVREMAALHPEWGPLPSLDTFERRRLREIDHGARVLARQGMEAYMDSRPWPTRDRGHLEAMDAVNADGHKFDVAVKFPDGVVRRPIILGWQDLSSGKLLAWRIGETESSELVRLAFADMAREYGIPRRAYLDNGRAFAAKSNTGGLPSRYRFRVKPGDQDGVLTLLGVDVRFVRPYNGRAKPIERAWRDFAQTISRRAEFSGAYLGNSPDNKPENYGERAVPFELFMRVVSDGIAEHNARKGRRAANCMGRSFDETFAASYERSPIRKATGEQLRLLLLASEAVKVNARGFVRIAGNHYWSEPLSPLSGQSVVLRFDPAALHTSVHVYLLDGTYVCEAPCTHRYGFDDAEQAKRVAKDKAEHARLGRRRLALEQSIGALLPDPMAMRARELQATPSASVVEIVKPKTTSTPERRRAESGGSVPTKFEEWATKRLKSRR
ncbi:MAG: transposase domain-containing protein [Lysobacterales bacterium]